MGSEPKTQDRISLKSQFYNLGFKNGDRQFCRYQYFHYEILYYLVSSCSPFFKSLKFKSSYMIRPRNGNSGVSFNNTRLHFGLCTLKEMYVQLYRLCTLKEMHVQLYRICTLKETYVLYRLFIHLPDMRTAIPFSCTFIPGQVYVSTNHTQGSVWIMNPEIWFIYSIQPNSG